MIRKIGIALGICIAAVVAIALFGMIVGRPLSEKKLETLGVIGPDSRFVDVEGVRTRYVTRGDGDEAMILIHGFSSSIYTWRACLEPLAKEYRVFALDLKGFGFSGKPEAEYTIDRYADFVVRFMDALGLQSATLCGNSMGGNISWRTALKYPDRVEKLILVDASGYASRHSGIPFFLKLGRLPGVGKLLAAFTTRGRIRSSLESAYYDTSKVTDHTVDAYYYPLRTEGGMRAVLARLKGSGSDVERWQGRIPEVQQPTLIIWGAHDTWIEPENADRFHRDIRGSRLVMIPGCGHLPQEETPGEFVASVLDFMAGIEREIVITEMPACPAPETSAAGLTI